MFWQMITDMWFGMPMDEAIKLQCDYQPTYQYQFNYKSWEDWVPKHLGDLIFSQSTQQIKNQPNTNIATHLAL